MLNDEERAEIEYWLEYMNKEEIKELLKQLRELPLHR